MIKMAKVSFLAALGLVLSCYAVYVEHKHSNETESDQPFKALCDIDQIGASCSAVFAMPQGKLLSYFNIVPHDHVLDVPNAVLGILYYALILINEAIINFPSFLIKFASTSAMSSSIYLAVVLTSLKELCILCWTTHVINTLLLYTILTRNTLKTKTS